MNPLDWMLLVYFLIVVITFLWAWPTLYRAEIRANAPIVPGTDDRLLCAMQATTLASILSLAWPEMFILWRMDNKR